MIVIAHSYFLHDDPKQLERMTPYSPLSTLIAAAMLEERGHTVSLFDATFAGGIAEFERLLDDKRPEVVALMEDNFNFLTKMCTMRRRQAALAMVAAARVRGCRVAVNGPDAADHPDQYLAAGAAVVILGEGETGLVDLVEAWASANDSAIDDIPGLLLPRDGGFIRTNARPALRNLDGLPIPAWHLLDAETYRRAWMGKHGRFSWNMVTSRGCPYPCNWCAKPIFGRGYEQRSPASVAREMRLVKNLLAPDHIWFADDIFGLTAEWIDEFAAEVAKQGARVPFMMQSRVNLMRPETVMALARAGAEEVWLGVESGSQKILDAMEKGTQVESARSATRTLKAHGIRACWFIQLGYPSETWEDLSLTRDLINEEMPDDIGVSVSYPLPGTRFHRLVQAQLGDRRNWEDSDELAMLFQGTYGTEFYRMIRDLLHDEVRTRMRDDGRWAALALEGAAHRSEHPVMLATGT